VRENLDPAGVHADRDMIAVLKDVRLWDILAGLIFSRAKASSPRGDAAASTDAGNRRGVSRSAEVAIGGGGTPPASPTAPPRSSPAASSWRRGSIPIAISGARWGRPALGIRNPEKIKSKLLRSTYKFSKIYFEHFCI
jgi:hypothetical protein